MKLIPLTQGKFAKVDDEDYEEVSKYKWRFDRYAVREVNGTSFFMHRLINQTPKGLITDHINQDKLDNRRSNLRTCTKSNNSMNANNHKRDPLAYKGISLFRGKVWEAYITFNYKRTHIGYFNTPEAAARAYDAKARELFREFAKTNFQEVIE
jgi:hypothetical protein